MKCMQKIHFDGRLYTCGGNHETADHNRLAHEAAVAGKPLDENLTPVNSEKKP